MDTFLTVDLDYFNGEDEPTSKLETIIKKIPQNIPSTFVIEHHKILPFFNKLLKYYTINRPINIINMDQHHDYYGGVEQDTRMRHINCGNWGYFLPLCYSKFVWVYGNSGGVFNQWDLAQDWLQGSCIQSISQQYYKFSTKKENIVAIAFSLSPDWLWPGTQTYLFDMVKVIKKHFNIKKMPKLIKPEMSKVESWKI